MELAVKKNHGILLSNSYETNRVATTLSSRKSLDARINAAGSEVAPFDKNHNNADNPEEKQHDYYDPLVGSLGLRH
jgi:hypothetical protein